jgi:DNA-directed RNA polymerase specialized sigma24 family protein
MISKMRDDIKKLVDFEKLKKCNDICHKWSSRFNVDKRDYMKFMYGIFKNPESVKNKLEVKYRSQFSKDCKVMFYAAEIENTLITQYHAMIFNIMKKLRIDQNDFDEYITDGFMAIRAATWQYRTYEVKASFTTYAHRAIFMRIKGKLFKEKEKKDRRCGLRINYESDYTDEAFSIDNHINCKQYSDSERDLEADIESVISKSKLNEQEAMMLRSFANHKMDDGRWYDEYRKKYINEKIGLPYSRQSIYNQLEIIHKKLFKFFRSNNMLPEKFDLSLIKREKIM